MKHPTCLPVFSILELHLEEALVGPQEGRVEINQWAEKSASCFKKKGERNIFTRSSGEVIGQNMLLFL